MATSKRRREQRGPAGAADADAIVDLHAGDANEGLVPHVYAATVGDAALDDRALALAHATGLDPVVLVRRLVPSRRPAPR
jgi:hypothetical protein